MSNPYQKRRKVLTVGFYKFINVIEPLATVDHKPNLNTNAVKERYAIDLAPLYYYKSTYPPQVGSLENRIIWVKAVHLADDPTDMPSVEWQFIQNKQDWNAAVAATGCGPVLQVEQPEAQTLVESSLSVDDLLGAYEAIRADALLRGIVDDGTGNDVPEDDYDEPSDCE